MLSFKSLNTISFSSLNIFTYRCFHIFARSKICGCSDVSFDFSSDYRSNFLSLCMSYSFLLKLDVLSNTVATLDSGPFPAPLPPTCIIFVVAFLSTCLFSNLPGLKLYNLFPLGCVATDSCAQVGFVFVRVFIFKSGLHGVASVFAQLSGQPITGQRLCSNTSSQ